MSCECDFVPVELVVHEEDKAGNNSLDPAGLCYAGDGLILTYRGLDYPLQDNPLTITMTVSRSDGPMAHPMRSICAGPVC